MLNEDLIVYYDKEFIHPIIVLSFDAADADFDAAGLA